MPAYACHPSKLQRDDVIGKSDRTKYRIACALSAHPAWNSNAAFLYGKHKLALKTTTSRQYARIVHRWVESIGLDPADYGTHTMRRTKATLIYRTTKNLRAIQLLLGHSRLESTVRYLGIEVDDALEIAEQTEI